MCVMLRRCECAESITDSAANNVVACLVYVMLEAAAEIDYVLFTFLCI